MGVYTVMSKRFAVLLGLVVAGVLAPLSFVAQADQTDRDWLLIDTQASTLTLMAGDRPRLTIDDIAIGRFGTSREKQRGDNTTPLGKFRVTRIEHDSTFHRFIGLDYPDRERAEKAYRDGIIDRRELQAIKAAHRRGKTPPQGTPLGGYIGIHGIGRGDPEIHRSMNWTKGCVALTNEQIETVLSSAYMGMLVEIR